MRACAAALLGLALSAAAAAPEPDAWQVVASPEVKVDAVNREELSRYFLKKTTRWPDGKAVVPVEPRAGSPVRERFAREVHQRSAGAMRSFWNQRVFSGRDVPPPEKGSDDELLSFVRATPGAVGYLSAGAKVSGVKILAVKD